MPLDDLTKGIVRSNPVFVLLLGICPTLATSGSLQTALAMGLAATFVLVSSNIVVSTIRGAIPKGVRIPCYIVIIATFVTMADLFLQGYAPGVSEEIGIFIPLIVVNCIILGRAEAFASKNGVGASALDGIGMGLGFTGALLLVSFIRELVGKGTLWGHPVLPGYNPIAVIASAPGAFLVLGFLLGLFNWLGALRKAQ
ncbi:MAG: electron transport complex subunit RsxE [Candidatus Brocadiae bacterium]|nr:electron transport complex subunit RsxE [Candidatus Brocadiia bacterium]